MANRFVLPFADVGGGITPSSGAQLFFFETGTADKKDTFSDQIGETPNPNPVIANQNGRFPAIFLEGTYKVILQNNKNKQIWEEDPIFSFISSDVVDNVVDLRAVTGQFNGQVINLLGHTSPGDQGGGDFFFDENSTDADDNGITIKPAFGTGRWIRLDTKRLDVAAYGAFGKANPPTVDSTTAIKGALASGATEIYADGRFLVSETLVIPRGVSLIGTGFDYWDTFRPAEDRLIKRMDTGLHLLFTGTGPKTQSALLLANARTAKTINTETYDLTKFTNEDSSAGVSATAKLFSVAIIMQEDSQLKNCRLVPEFDGIDGYNDFVTTGIGSDWDVGIWARGCNEGHIDNVQSVGYWRMGGLLVTENDGTYTQLGNNSERLRVDKLTSQGIRGLIFRNGPQIKVISNTNTEIVMDYFPSYTVTSQNDFRIFGDSLIYTFTGFSASGSEITLTGVTPNLPASVSAVRSVTLGNGFARTVFNDCVFTGFEHSSGTASDDLPHGLPIAGPAEFDGFPIRGVTAVNSKFQTTFDKMNVLFADIRDFKTVNCQFENGELIAYNNTVEIGFTENHRLSNTFISPQTGITGFTPRELYNDHDQFPTLFTNGEFILKPALDGVNIEIRDFDDTLLMTFNPTTNDVELKDYNGNRLIKRVGSSNELQLGAEAFSINRISDAAGLLRIFAGSGNAQFFANVTIDGEGVIGGASVRPISDLSATVGAASFFFSTTFTDSIKMRSPDSTVFTVTVDNGGNLVVT